MHPALAHIDHRPWQLPGSAWTWRQTWQTLLFAHWRVAKTELEMLLPRALELEEFDGSAWIGLVPFEMSGVMRRPFPDLPWISAFPELNVRTYVRHRGKPGVWFFSLDATNPLAVWAARRFFHLPYFRARMSLASTWRGVHYESRRDGARFVADYRPTSTPYLAQPGTLEHWLTERYCLYAQRSDGALLRNEVHHVPWPLQRAQVEIIENSLFDFHGMDVTGPPEVVHYAARLDVVVWPADVCEPAPGEA